MERQRWLRLGALTLLGAAALVTGVSTPAGAEVTGPCTATIKGVDIGGLSSTRAGDAIDVDYQETVVAAATSTAPIDGYKVQLEFGGFTWTVARGGANGTSWSREVNVKDYASHGVGLYKVKGASTGAGACAGAALLKITGKSPLTTTAGLAGTAMVGLGALGIGGSTVRSVRSAAGRR